MRAFFFILFSISQIAQVLAQNANVQKTGVEGVRNMTIELTRDVQNNMSNLGAGCFAECGDSPRASQTCADAYADLYAKPVVKMSVTLGYTDVERTFSDRAHNYLAAEDSIRRQVWEKNLLTPCYRFPDGAEAVGTCGFTKPDDDDADLFTKTVVGPDGKDHKVELRLTHSSASYSDSQNRTTLKAQQEIQTRLAERNFYGGAGSADVWISAGHDRRGGGTTHSPPPLKPGTNAVNLGAFADRAPARRLLTVLRGNPNPPKIIARFACDSAGSSEAELRSATRNQSGVLSSVGLTEPGIVYAQAFAALDSVLTMRCATEFDRALNAVKDEAPFNRRNRLGKGARRVGFFGDTHPRFQFIDTAAVPDAVRSETPLNDQPIRPAGDGQPTHPQTQGSDSLK